MAVAALAAVVASLVLAGEPRTRWLMLNTLLLAVSVSSASVVIGVPLAFLLARTDTVGRRAGSVALVALLFIPLYLEAAAWQAAFGPGGWYSAALGLPAMLDGWRGAIAIHALAAIPWVAVLTAVNLRQAEPELEEEALLDATPTGVFRHVTLRRVADAAMTAGLWVGVATAGEITVTDLFQIRTYAEEVYTQTALGEGDAGGLLGGVLPLIALIAIGVLAIGRLIPADWQSAQRSTRLFRLGPWRLPASLFVIGIVGTLLAVPTFSLLAKAGRVVSRSDNGLVRHWSAEQCWTMIAESPGRFRAELGWSAAIAATAACTAVAVAVPLAWRARNAPAAALLLWLVVGAALAVPGPLLGVGIISLMNQPGWTWLNLLYDHTIAAVWLAQTVRALPVCTLVLWYGLRTVPAELLVSATLDGAAPTVRWLRIVLPQRWPVIVVAALAAFVIAWSELSASILVVPPGITTLPIQIFGLIHYGVDDRLAGVSLVVMAASAAVAAMIVAVARRLDDSEIR
jgi:iron(III) transport system permease protein